ncbi:MAG: pds [Planctomycetaceae bacterium]|nr:pds [Planctomycetaceae bacterium]
MPHVVIVGGGLAGMAAAVALVKSDFRVTLLESRPRLGGRASSFVDQTTGTTIDNCQHVNLGCCTNFLHFCQETGIADSLRTEHSLTFVGPNRRLHSLKASWLPAPLHLLPSFARLSYLSWYDKWRLAWGLRALAHRRNATSEMLMSDWLVQQRQTPGTISRVWQVVLVSALSETLDRITVRDARKVFVDAFLANRHGWEMQVPTVPLDTLYSERVGEWLRSHHVDVRQQVGVKQIAIADNRVQHVVLRDGQLIDADDLILAVPARLVAALLPSGIAQHPTLSQLEQLEWAPISSVHLWFDRPFLPVPHATLVDRLSQWIFSRGSTVQPDGTLAEYYQVVISASRMLANRTQLEIVADIVRELSEIWPEAAAARLLKSRVVTEHKACLSMLPGNDKLRPDQATIVSNLFLAGDWTRTGWPSTMEGAVRSGYLAAEAICRRHGTPRAFVQPDLPVSRLSRLLFGL